MRALLLVAWACTLAACVSTGADPVDDPAEVDDVHDEEPTAALSDDDPWVVYKREQDAFWASLDRPQPVPTTRRERRRARRAERKPLANCRRGQAAAEASIRADALGVLMLGLPADCWYDYRERAHEELGIGLGCMGCVVDSFTGPYVSCFNTVMEREIETRGLADDLARLGDETCGHPERPAAGRE